MKTNIPCPWPGLSLEIEVLPSEILLSVIFKAKVAMTRYGLTLRNAQDHTRVLELAQAYDLDILERNNFHVEFYSRRDLVLIHRLLKR